MKRLLLILCAASPLIAKAQPDGCYARIDGDTLRMGNARIERCWVWNGGNPATAALIDKTTGQRLEARASKPDFQLGRGTVSRTSFATETVAANPVHPACLKAIVSFALGGLEVRREYRIYADCPAIACDTYLRGTVEELQRGGAAAAADRTNIEQARDMQTEPVAATLDRLQFTGNHWRVKTVEFRDVTDWNDNLVSESYTISYRRTGHRGNLLFARNADGGGAFFFLKEAPSSSVQLAWSGEDFVTDFGEFSVTGAGITPADLDAEQWTRIYGCVTGVGGRDELSALMALRCYQKCCRRYLPERDAMIMMNTWGDRSQDTKVNEAFCLAELERAARLGITHFQIDDGWQQGKSPNSALAKGSFSDIWSRSDYWTPDAEKYPRGLRPVTERAAELGIEVGLWFNPSVQNDFADWEKDAAALIGLYRDYGIRVFKIDGLSVPTKRAEINLRKLLDCVSAATEHRVVFNLDGTAGRRCGYHFMNEYGNIFLENRYTDWGNYYPYRTLRNLWMLARYVPAERLQIEFLNNRRNVDKYGSDPFAPARYDFDYLFATTLAAQPLAWMEASNLAEADFALRATVDAYKAVADDFHCGTILPVGEEPSGRAWTGFQSISDERSGFLLIFREDNDAVRGSVATWLPEGATVVCTPVFGHGARCRQQVAAGGRIFTILPKRNDYVLYRYRIVKR